MPTIQPDLDNALCKGSAWLSLGGVQLAVKINHHSKGTVHQRTNRVRNYSVYIQRNINQSLERRNLIPPDYINRWENNMLDKINQS